MVLILLEEVITLQVSFTPIYVREPGFCTAEELVQEPEEEQEV